MKKIKEREDKEQQSTERKSGNKNVVIASDSFYTSSNLLCVDNNPYLFPTADEGDLLKRPKSIFHPPAA